MQTLTTSKRPPRLFIFLLGLLAVTALALLPGARAADFSAATEAELVAAINAANAAGAGSHTIELTADITLSAALPPLDNAAATDILLEGNSHTLDANGAGTALAIMPDTTVAVTNLTITGGAGSMGLDGQSGGGIFNMGTLSVTDSQISGNTATHGAGILNAGGEKGSSAALTLTRVTLRGNAASNAGGALANHGDSSTAAATITDSKLVDNNATQYGGGISNNGLEGAADLTITNTTLSGNDANLGGGLFNNGNGGQAIATLNRVTLSGNTGSDSGGGLFNNGNLGTATIALLNSTVSGNTAGKSGGGLTSTANGGTALVTLRFVTVANNAAPTGGGFFNSTAAVIEASASIFAAGNQGKACAFNGGTALTSGGYNLDTDNSCVLGGTGDVSGGNAGLLALTLNAPGDTATHALEAASDAQRRVPAGAAGCGAAVAADQRGAARPNPAPSCDIGAYESNLTAGGGTATPTATGTPPTPTATTTATATATATATTTPPEGCAPPYVPANETQLNEAIACVNAAAGGTQTITLAADIELTGPAAPISNPFAAEVILDGAGHTLDGNRKGTVLTIIGPTKTRVRNLSITGGQGSSGPEGNWAGGIFNTGALTLENSTLFANLATQGGGIANYASGVEVTLTVIRSTLSGNVATGTGGGIANVGANGGSATTRVENATLTGNYAAAGGGGLYNEADNGNATAALHYATFGLNTATSGGGGIHATTKGGGSTVTLSASIVTNGAGAGPDCAAPNGTLLSSGYNLAGDGTCNLNQATDQPAANAVLLPPAVNPPGDTATHALGPNSAALDRVPNGAAGCGTTYATDQRGAARPYPAGGLCDLGAYESQATVAEPAAEVYLPLVTEP